MTSFLFRRRRALDDFAEAIRPELRALETPDATPALLTRILASRASGERVILPRPSEARPRVMTPARTTIAIAAGVLALVVPASRRRPAAVDDIVATSGLFARDAYAQPPEPAHPALAPLALSRASSIRPLTLELSRRMLDAAGQVATESLDRTALSPSEWEGAPAWRIVSTAHDDWSAQRRVVTETLYVARGDLRLLARAVHAAPYSRFARINVQQRFRGDSITGRMTTDAPSIGDGRAIARQLRQPFAPYLTGPFAPIALMATPLSTTFAASASLLGWAVIPHDVFAPIELRVQGEERVTVPAGTFDCWRISIRLGGREIGYWARKRDGLGVRIIDHPTSDARTLETVLVRVTE